MAWCLAACLVPLWQWQVLRAASLLGRRVACRRAPPAGGPPGDPRVAWPGQDRSGVPARPPSGAERSSRQAHDGRAHHHAPRPAPAPHVDVVGEEEAGPPARCCSRLPFGRGRRQEVSRVVGRMMQGGAVLQESRRCFHSARAGRDRSSDRCHDSSASASAHSPSTIVVGIWKWG